MKLKIKIHANSSQEKIKKIADCKYEIWVKEKPIKGKANEKILKILKKYFNKKIKIIKGLNSRNKIVEVFQ